MPLTRKNRNNRNKTCPVLSLSTINPIQTGLVSTPVSVDERSATNRMNSDMAESRPMERV